MRSAANTGLMRITDAAAVNLAYNNTSANVALPAGCLSYRIANNGSGGVFIRFGVAGVTADATSGIFLGAGAAEAFEATPGITHVAALQVTGSGTLNILGTTGQ